MTTAMRRLLPAALVAACPVLLSLSAGTFAASPSEDTIDAPKDEVTWTGTFTASNPGGCAGAAVDPTCDHFIIRIASSGVRRVLVAISPNEGFEDDDYDLFVYDDQGNLVASNADGDGRESVVFENTGAAYYEVRVQPWLVDPGSTYTGVAMRTREQAIEPEAAAADCLEAAPEAVGLPVLDSGQPIELAVMMLLDGTDGAVAQQLMARAAQSYAERNIRLVVKSTKAVTFTSPTSEGLIAESKAAVGGVPPRGIDIVGTLTNKEMQAATGGAGTVVGQADCIGGIRWPEHSFFVATDIRDIEDPQTGNSGTINQLGFNPNVAAASEVLSHEIGHLMGAHHHYANCAEGNLSFDADNDLSPCTLMFNAVNFSSLSFGTLEGAVVRGHAVSFAAP
jgi:hypothetical protein